MRVEAYRRVRALARLGAEAFDLDLCGQALLECDGVDLVAHVDLIGELGGRRGSRGGSRGVSRGGSDGKEQEVRVWACARTRAMTEMKARAAAPKVSWPCVLFSNVGSGGGGAGGGGGEISSWYMPPGALRGEQ